MAARRILVGKFSSNDGQACIAPDYVLVEEHLAPKLVNCFHPGLKMSDTCHNLQWAGAK